MKNKIKIRVTRQHIKNGNACSAGSCPIALAVEEQLDTTSVSVGSKSCVFSFANNHNSYKLSRAAQRFIQKFDNDKRVKPFSFIMTLEGTSAFKL